MASSSSETAPVKTVQLDGKVIAITGANRGMCNALINLISPALPKKYPIIQSDIHQASASA